MQDCPTVLLKALFILNEHSRGEFHERLFEAATLLFPDTVYSLELWHTGNNEHSYAINIDYTGHDAGYLMQRVGELVPVEHPAYPYIAQGKLDPIRLEDLVTHRQFRNTELYQIAFKPVEIRHQISIPFTTDTHVGGLTINRLGRKPFSTEDLKLACLFAPFVMQAHQISEWLRLCKRQAEKLAGSDFAPLRHDGLTRRECEVLHWISHGKRDREIAAILGISHRTVTTHVHSILSKLGVETRTAAAAFVSNPQP